MNFEEARYYLDKTRRKYILIRVTELILSSVAVAFLVIAVLQMTPSSRMWRLLISVGTGLIFFTLRAIQLRIFQITNAGVASYLNRHYPALEESVDLILKKEEDLTSIQQLQKARSVQHLESLYPSIKLPSHIGRTLLLFLISILGYVLVNNFAKTTSQPKADLNSPSSVVVDNKLASLKELNIRVTPPAYTNLKPRNTNDFNLRVQEGSLILWDLSFEGVALDPHFIFSGKDSVRLNADRNNSFKIDRITNSSSFYNIAWSNQDGSKKSSDFYHLEVIKDQPPVINLSNLNQFTELSLNEKLTVDLRPTLTDDYSVQDAYIIATVSKGSGESIKFREVKMSFDRPSAVKGALVKPSLTIDILKLGLEPGDELYFYIEALDNKTPLPNRSRTETFFIALKDTSTVTTSVDAGLGVDLMPEYFRSQRQIIIDSEKLLREKKSISKETFNSRSNSLAYDQKVLRLRYGEFLGEEFESGIGPQPATDEDHAGEENVTEKYGHVHDKDNEHNLVQEKKSATKDGHDHSSEDKDDPLKEFTHSHDSQEEATFFTQSIRAKLKAAITIMWEAELHLRLYDPQRSLPYQYRALKLLKEISQDSRIYVHRTGFEPPPLKEEKRLTGDLSEIKNSTAFSEKTKKETYPGIRQAIRQTEHLLAFEMVSLTPGTRSLFESAGQELATVAIQQPGRYLKTLSLLKALAENDVESSQIRPTLIEVRRELWRLLPVETPSPQSSGRTPHKLDDEFLENLELLKRE
jgi:hypothetical protein